MVERLAHHLCPTDILARLGGGEFGIVAEAMPDDAAKEQPA